MTEGVESRHKYDGFGRRIERDHNGGIQRYVYDGEDVLLELDSSNNVVAEYTFYPGTDHVHTMKRGGEMYYYAQGQQGTVLGLFDDDGNVVNKYRDAPWGNVESTSTTVYNPIRHAGAWFDPSPVRLVYLRNRYYDPHMRRFISEDPIGLAGGINPYVYAGNDPVNRTDRFGLSADDKECYYTGQIINGVRVAACELTVEIEVEGDGGGGRLPTPPRGFPVSGFGSGSSGGGFGGGSGGAFGPGPRQEAPAPPQPQPDRPGFLTALGACTLDHFVGTGEADKLLGLAGRAVSLPVPKPWLRAPVVGTSSEYTNLISFVGRRTLPARWPHGTKVLGTRRVFGSIGRFAGRYVLPPVLLYDAFRVGQCLNRF